MFNEEAGATALGSLDTVVAAADVLPNDDCGTAMVAERATFIEPDKLGTRATLRTRLLLLLLLSSAAAAVVAFFFNDTLADAGSVSSS